MDDADLDDWICGHGFPDHYYHVDDSLTEASPTSTAPPPDLPQPPPDIPNPDGPPPAIPIPPPVPQNIPWHLLHTLPAPPLSTGQLLKRNAHRQGMASDDYPWAPRPSYRDTFHAPKTGRHVWFYHFQKHKTLAP